MRFGSRPPRSRYAVTGHGARVVRLPRGHGAPSTVTNYRGLRPQKAICRGPKRNGAFSLWTPGLQPETRCTNLKPPLVNGADDGVVRAVSKAVPWRHGRRDQHVIST